MKRFIVTIILGLVCSMAHAVNVVEQRYIDQLTRGGSVSIKQAAQSIYNTGMDNPEVLDVAAEVLLQRYPNARKSDIDALAWLCRAIGNSQNGRYYSALDEVVESDAHRKLRKYADKALGEIGGKKGGQYKKGTIDIAVLRSGASKSKASKPKAKTSASKAKSGKNGLDVVLEGMSMEEVYDLVGTPTATTTHQTGKAWIPFNYGAKDLARTILLYKGQGRVVCSHDGYSSTSRVMEVIIDPEETGYP